MEFIMAPLIIGIITFGIYRISELYARRKERLAIIEKMTDKFDPSQIESKLDMSHLFAGRFSYGALKGGCLLIGVGLGLMIGFLISLSCIQGYNVVEDYSRRIDELTGIVYGSSVLIFGGIGLLTAFLLEIKYSRKKEV